MADDTVPLIGITTYGRTSDNHFTLPAEYVEAVRRAGGIPVLIPPGEEAMDALLARLDGLILAGGGDIAPAHYNGVMHETIYMVDDERDRMELQIAQRLATGEQPLLGICRGAQVINVALGGTLIEHLPEEMGEAIVHRAPPRNPIRHGVRLAPTSLLAEILGAESIHAASWHHQAVRRVAPGLEVTAYAPDGAVEALEKPDHPWLIAVQWHPEITAAEDPVQQRMFDALVEAARDYAENRTRISQIGRIGAEVIG